MQAEQWNNGKKDKVLFIIHVLFLMLKSNYQFKVIANYQSLAQPKGKKVRNVIQSNRVKREQGELPLPFWCLLWFRPYLYHRKKFTFTIYKIFDHRNLLTSKRAPESLRCRVAAFPSPQVPFPTSFYQSQPVCGISCPQPSRYLRSWLRENGSCSPDTVLNPDGYWLGLRSSDTRNPWSYSLLVIQVQII